MSHLKALLLVDHNLHPSPRATAFHPPGLQEPTLPLHARYVLHLESERLVSISHSERGQESTLWSPKGWGQMSLSRSPHEPWISNLHHGRQELHAEPRHALPSGLVTKSIHPCLTAFYPSPPGEQIPDSNMEVKGTDKFMLAKLTLFG